MSFVNIHQALERERRMSQIMARMSSLSPEQLRRVATLLDAQERVDSVASANNFPMSGGQDLIQRQMNNITASQRETIMSNLTQSLGYRPSDSDIRELRTLRTQFPGDSFSSNMRVIASNVGAIPGGVGALLRGLDTGNIQGVVNSATKIAASILASQEIPTPNLNNISSTINSAITSITDIASEVTTAVQNQLSSGIDQVNELLNDVSRDIQVEISEFRDSILTSSQATELNELATAIASSPTTPAIPTNSVGEQYDTAPMDSNIEVSSAPVTADSLRRAP